MAITVVDKEKALWEWAKENPFLTDRLLFDYLDLKQGSCSISPVSADERVKQFIDGSQLRQYTFALQIILPVSDTSDLINLENMYTMRTWQEWINQQQREQNYPDFGPNVIEYELFNMNNMPQMALRYENGIAKYQFFANILYLELEDE